ncbi:hypothetical protein KI809_02665 [Geobacter pelophilus]|uniref:Cytochrome c domain-containing protein n=1 Tax=Geoanaerobacter pelophilus TaxID=60036 RepID=A0AAW4L0Z1_9BACT|nr:hypothetical protein [Geoanaerobacter pelophilus]MBT0663192.1 hypothetical protein [Geoanaerobacter pelophilus]
MPGMRKMTLVMAILLLCGGYVGTAYAIPAFSRQHKVECTTCHTIYPELNEYGEAFLKNSYVYTHTKLQVEKPAAPVILGGGGDPALLEKLKAQAPESAASKVAGPAATKNEGLWLAAIPEQLPLSVTATLNASYNKNAPNNGEYDLSTRAVALQAGGNFREKFGFFAKYTLYSEGVYNPTVGNALASNANVPKNNGSELNELFLTWRQPMDLPVNLKFGRFRPKLSLWKSSNKIAVASFATHSYTVGKSPFTIDSPQDGVELNAVVAKRLFMAAGVVDRNGQKNKEGYGHLSYKIGGADFLGNEPMIDLDSDSIWDYLSIMIATYGYSGRNANIVAGVGQNYNDYYRLGVDLEILYQKLRLRASGVKGRDNNPDFSTIKGYINSLAVSAEAEYMFDTNIIAAMRYEYLFDQTYTGERHVYSPYLAYSPLQNIRLVLEYRYEDYVTPTITDNKIANVGLSFSF